MSPVAETPGEPTSASQDSHPSETPSLGKLGRWLASPPAWRWLPIVGTLLCLPAVFGQFVLDDNVLALLARAEPGVEGFESRPLDLFRFTTGVPAENHKLMDEGVLLPWWTTPQLRIAFFRPLSSLTHQLDFALFGTTAAPMYAHNLLWMWVLLLIAGRVYSGLCDTPGLAGLALLLYAVDDTHGAAVGWIAARNALLATALTLPALLAHHRARTADGRWWAGPLWLCAGLLAGETALGLGGFLVAYALCLDRGRLTTRALSLLPYGAVVVLWWVGYKAAGFGAHGSGLYTDPGREPLLFLHSLSQNWPALLAGQFGLGFPPIGDMTAWASPEALPSLLQASILTIAVLAAIAWPVLRRDAHARFWALGCALSALPVAASVPGERLLVFSSLGAGGLLAKLIAHYGTRAALTTGPRLPRLLFGLLVLTHLVAGPLGLPMRSASMKLLGLTLERAEQSLPSTPEVRDQTFVLLDAPFDVLASHLQLMREVTGTPRPRHLYWLSSGSSATSFEVTSPSSLTLTPERGFLYTRLERHYRGTPNELGVGAEVKLSEMTAHVLEQTADGRPAKVEFRFRRPLSDPSYRFFHFHAGRFRPAALPAPGVRVRLPERGFYPTLIRTGLDWFGLSPQAEAAPGLLP